MSTFQLQDISNTFKSAFKLYFEPLFWFLDAVRKVSNWFFRELILQEGKSSIEASPSSKSEMPIESGEKMLLSLKFTPSFKNVRETTKKELIDKISREKKNLYIYATQPTLIYFKSDIESLDSDESKTQDKIRSELRKIEQELIPYNVSLYSSVYKIPEAFTVDELKEISNLYGIEARMSKFEEYDDLLFPRFIKLLSLIKGLSKKDLEIYVTNITEIISKR